MQGKPANISRNRAVLGILWNLKPSAASSHPRQCPADPRLLVSLKLLIGYYINQFYVKPNPERILFKNSYFLCHLNLS